MNICVSCRHCRRIETAGPRVDCDYNVRCAAQDLAAIPTVDPVTGATGYMMRNDLGGAYFAGTIEEARPTCRSRNPDGACRDFERVEAGR